MNTAVARRFAASCLKSITVVLIIGGAGMNGAEPATTGAGIAPLVEANNLFACDLYGKLRSEQGNLFFSPNSIFTALDMTTAGARGETAAQMRKVLQLDSAGDAHGGEKLHAAAAELIQRLNDGGKGGAYQLTVANRLWGQQGYPFLAPFTKILHDDYAAEMTPLDFGRPDTARQTINLWVEQATNDKIKDLIPQGALTPLTRLVLTNAVYFKGTWEDVFRKESTRPMRFHLTAANSVYVPMMYQKEHHEFGQATFGNNKGLKVLKLAYKKAAPEEKGLSMILLLPDDVAGLADLEAQLTSENLNKWTSGSRTEEVMVWLPKLKLPSQF
jgi:serpin B